jgi:DNA polymerase
VSKKELMDDLITAVETCRGCHLRSHARNPVPGEGSLDATLMFVGEAPGYWEDVKGRPFVGRAGKLLDELLSSVSLERRNVYISNLIKHRPPENRDPRQDEIQACTPYLDRQIQIIAPKVIVPLGRHAARYLLSKINTESKGITEARGKIHRADLFGFQLDIVPTFHPAAALYNPSYKTALQEDFKTIRSAL